jgi:hypothetical protein
MCHIGQPISVSPPADVNHKKAFVLALARDPAMDHGTWTKFHGKRVKINCLQKKQAEQV